MPLYTYRNTANSLTIIDRSRMVGMTLPHRILIDDHQIGILQSKQIRIEGMPPGSHELTVQSMIPFFKATEKIEVRSGDNVVVFHDRESAWNVFFGIDLVLWIVKRFLALSATVSLWYEIITNGYFALWIIYEIAIHKRYFRIHQE